MQNTNKIFQKHTKNGDIYQQVWSKSTTATHSIIPAWVPILAWINLNTSMDK